MTSNPRIPIIGNEILSDERARFQIDNSILASLIALNQSIGQLQGEIAVLKASGVPIEEIQKDIENLNRIIINGDVNAESLIQQIRRYKESIDDIKDRVKKTEDVLKKIEQDTAEVTSEKKIINLQNWWQVGLLIIGALITGGLGWLGIK